MSLNSDQLDAFFEVGKSGNFSKAAKVLFISQPALSQRVQRLEQTMGTTLFIRNGSRAELTPAGLELFRHCSTLKNLEQSLLKDLGKTDRENSVSIRIAGYSSIVRSFVIPALTPLLSGKSDFPNLELFTRETHELPQVLKKLQADYVITDKPMELARVVSHKIGHENYVLIESKNKKTNASVYFDHDPEDQTTANFWKIQANPPTKIKRAYLDEVYAIADAVEAGWGRAVLPIHLVEKNTNLKIVKGLRPMQNPVYLHYFEQVFYPNYHEKILKQLSHFG